MQLETDLTFYNLDLTKTWLSQMEAKPFRESDAESDAESDNQFSF
jgi:hypothetical protein